MENLTADLCASREFFFAVFADSGGKALLEVCFWEPLPRWSKPARRGGLSPRAAGSRCCRRRSPPLRTGHAPVSHGCSCARPMLPMKHQLSPRRRPDASQRVPAQVYAWVPLAGAIVTVLLAACHAAADRFSAAYRRLDVAQRLVTSFHLAYTLAYGIAVVPFTYYLCRLLFSDLQDAASTYLPVLICFNLNLSLYLAEAAARAVVKRWACGDGIGGRQAAVPAGSPGSLARGMVASLCPARPPPRRPTPPSAGAGCCSSTTPFSRPPPWWAFTRCSRRGCAAPAWAVSCQGCQGAEDAGRTNAPPPPLPLSPTFQFTLFGLKFGGIFTLFAM